MALFAKIWAGLTMSCIVILIVIIGKTLEHQQVFSKPESRFFAVRKKITGHLAQLREQYARAEEDVYINTLEDIQELWQFRDLYVHEFKEHPPKFPADSLQNLEVLIGQHASILRVCLEIDRVQQQNENLNNISTP